MMTPLPRWVLLATLLGRAIGVPIQDGLVDDACVRFCRTLEGTSSEGCAPRTLVRLQSYERHVGRRNDLARCLISSCYDKIESNPIQSTNDHREQICERIRQGFVKSQQCGCLDPISKSDLLGKLFQKKSQEDPSWDSLEEILMRYDRYVRNFGLLGKLELIEDPMDSRMIKKPREFVGFESRLVVSPDSGATGENKKRVSMHFNGVPSVVDIKMDDDAGSHSQATTTESNSSEEQVDWEMWCMTQCDHGQGGTACNCDIIP